MNLDPKKDFLNSPHKAKWADVAASETFTAAVTTALVIQQQNLNAAPDLATAASFHYRMEGAKQFLGILMNLAEVKAPAEAKPGTPNLSWGTKP